jgi:predicted  nucleic acid-binding Zn-ribbon protein
MPDSATPVIITALSVVMAALITAIVGMYPAWVEKKKREKEAALTEAEKRKTDAEAFDLITGTALELLKPLKDENEKMRQRLADHEKRIAALEEINSELRKDNSELRTALIRLHGQLVSLNITPVVDAPHPGK